MIRTTTLATLSVLALYGCIATPASAQYFYGILQSDCADGYCYSDRVYGHFRYFDTALSRYHATPVYHESAYPYGSNGICRQETGCPLQRGRVYPNRLMGDFQPDIGLPTPGHNYSHSPDRHNGHPYEGHSRDSHSHDRRNPSRSVAPSDRGYLAPPSLPRDRARDFQPQQDFRRERPQRDESIRMDNSPPALFEPTSPSLPSTGNPKRFDAPPPATL